MMGILTAEMLIEGQKGGRLTWPYGDLVPGNYLAKVGLPAFTVMVALAVGAKPRLASLMGILSLFSLAMSVLTGERINFLIQRLRRHAGSACLEASYQTISYSCAG